MRAALLLGALGALHVPDAQAVGPLRLSAAVYADYDSELREATARGDGIKHVDTPQLIQRLRSGNIKTYAYLVWHRPTDWDDFRLEFLPAAQAAGLDVWLYLTPPSENKPPDGYVPYGSNYVTWAVETAKLAQQYPVLKALAIDDFNSNLSLFTPDYVREMMDSAHVYCSNLVFLPVNYDWSAGLSNPAGLISPAFANAYGPYIDGLIFPYLNWTNKEDFSDEYAQVLNNQNILQGKVAQFVVSFPSSTPSQPGDRAALTQTLTNAAGFPDAPYPFQFRLYDTYSGPTSNYHKLQVLVDGVTVWEGDTAGATGLQDISLNLQAQLKGKQAAGLTVRIYDAQGVFNYRVTVNWNLPAGNWTLSETGSFTGTSTYYPAMASLNIPLIVMIYDGGYGSGTNRWTPTLDYVRQANTIAQSAVSDGHALGIIQYCLDKSDGSQQFPIVRDLYAQWAFRPRFNRITPIQNGQVLLSGENGLPNAGYSLMVSDWTGAPEIAWTPLCNSVFDDQGRFTNIDSSLPNSSNRFYLISVP